MPEYPSPVRSRKGTFDARGGGVTTAVISYPDTVSSGDRIVCVIAGDTAQTFTFPAGWTELDQVSGSNSIGVFWETADGTEGGSTFTVTFTTADRDMTALVWAIPSSGTPEISSVLTQTSTSWDVPSLTPSGGSDQYLWLAVGAFDAAGANLREVPDGFGAWAAWPGSPSVYAVGCERVETASSLDPGSFRTASGGVGHAALVAVPVSTSAPADFPVIESDPAETLWTTATTSQAINLPSSIASGDYLIAEVSVGSGETVTGMTGWTQIATVAQTGFVSAHIFEREADGTEGATVTASISGSGARGAAAVRRLSSVDTSATEVATLTGVVGDTKFDWPSLTPTGGSANIAWLVGCSMFGDRGPYRWASDTAGDMTDRGEIHVSPCENNAPNNTTANIGLFSAIQLKAASSLHPANTNSSAAIRGVAWTVAIYPSGGGGGAGVGESWGMIAA